MIALGGKMAPNHRPHKMGVCLWERRGWGKREREREGRERESERERERASEKEREREPAQFTT
jgi:hypothetical protein